MLDGSLQVHRRQGAQGQGRTHRRENISNIDVPNGLDRYQGRTTGMRPLSLDASSNMQRTAEGISVDCQVWRHESSAVPLEGYTSPQDKSTAGGETVPKEAGGLETSRQIDIERTEASGHTRSSTNLPGAQHSPRVGDIGRRRSQSTGFGSRGSRIAALSVQLRTRLSYAAARIEKARQSQSQYQSPTGLLQKNSSTPILSVETLSRTGQPSLGEPGDQFEAGSPDGTTVSAPDAPAASSRHPFEGPIRQTLNATIDVNSQTQPDLNKHAEYHPELRPPRLAPPADIDPGRVNRQRRRPNPNNPSNPSRYAPFPLHRRGRSQQELVADTEVTRVPETPPLCPSNDNGIPFHGWSDNSQSSSMEQDAIETLLFMSSPGTSGYHSNSQNSQRNQDVRNIDDSASQSVKWHGSLNGTQSDRQSGLTGTVETRTGDEIDLMLDQMNSDSDDDADYTFRRSIRVEAGSRANDAVGSNVQHGT
ncbi:hypothetical protein AN6333.2 [Aspergillus nidulans FGSC A4]|uniref:Uncharacterized protein n=1 Tax=Emericella nidulans (strain FGSC A4 / ATCC 38163 / CBS 112.46 / NRRL 194 / M139) TaxID=227321 RepID=Q5AZE7_EMENI|nr:hypothetical protein [Aspergillus nidulans FGSC A4]EAA58717.1 hypothetical protein AN6333.2 [Aspergillus nidulans FGSC A4]CBF69682.1 TPA: conserved hypothetical protein [Aspergillus nidulans FGSC A4]|eukprot:XP_663937.1 hypothetical protein AN6333.2 [Aspergillus nidulans FGSC A4]